MKIKESEKRDKYSGFAKAVDNAGDSDSDYYWCTWNGPQTLGK